MSQWGGGPVNVVLFLLGEREARRGRARRFPGRALRIATQSDVFRTEVTRVMRKTTIENATTRVTFDGYPSIL